MSVREGPSALVDGREPFPAPSSAAEHRTGLERCRTTVRRTLTDVPVLAVGAVALAARLVYLLAFTGSYRLNSDAAQYSIIADNLAHGRGFADVYPQLALHATAFRPPLYPLLLSAFYAVFGVSPGLGRGVNVGLGVLGVCLVVVLVRRHISTRAGILAGLAMAVSPNLVANSTFTLSEPLGMIWLVLLLGAIVARRWTWTGVLLALLLLTRPSAQALAIVVLVWVVVACWRRWRQLLAFVVPVVVLVGAWGVRNWIQLGSPVYVTSSGYNWAAIYSPPAQAADWFVDPIHDPWFDFLRLDQFDEVTWSSDLQRIGIKALAHNPTYAADVAKRNALAYFELRPGDNVSAERLDGRNLRVRADTLWLFYVSLVLGVAGLGLGWRRRLVQLLVLEAAAFAAVSLAFVAPPRLRSPVDLALAVGTGLTLDAAWRWWQARRRPRAADPPRPARPSHPAAPLSPPPPPPPPP